MSKSSIIDDTDEGTMHDLHSPRLINISHFTTFAQGPRTDLVSKCHTSQPRSFGLTFRPRFYISKNSRRFKVGNKEVRALGPASCTELPLLAYSFDQIDHILKNKYQGTQNWYKWKDTSDTCSNNPGCVFWGNKHACGRIIEHGVLGGTMTSLWVDMY